MKKWQLIPVFLIAGAMCLPSCSGKPNKSANQEAPAAETASKTQQPGAENRNTASGKAPATVKAPKNRTAAELLAALPCKLDAKKGAFAVFPDNPVAGQNCFGLYPAGQTGQKPPTFDIMTDGMYIIFHDLSGTTPPAVTLMRWENRNGQPCLEKSCGKAVPTRTESRNAPGNNGWTYTIVFPQNPADLVSEGGDFYGVVINNEQNQAPLFY